MYVRCRICSFRCIGGRGFFGLLSFGLKHALGFRQAAGCEFQRMLFGYVVEVPGAIQEL